MHNSIWDASFKMLMVALGALMFFSVIVIRRLIKERIEQLKKKDGEEPIKEVGKDLKEESRDREESRTKIPEIFDTQNSSTRVAHY